MKGNVITPRNKSGGRKKKKRGGKGRGCITIFLLICSTFGDQWGWGVQKISECFPAPLFSPL